MRCLSKITDTQGNEFNLMQINDFSVITSTIKGYTSPTTTNIWQAGSHTPPSWMSAQGDLLCKVNTSTVAQLQENKMVDNDYLLFKYGRVIQGSDNFYGMGFYNNKNSAVRLDTFGDGPSIGNQTVDCYLGIVLDDDNQRAYILACTDKYNDPSNNKFRIWALAGKYNGTDLYWETFGEVILNQSAGGAGLYGGYKGGAGSGYIGNSLVSNKKMVGYNVPTSSAEGTKTESVNVFDSNYVANKPKAGNGFARIKFLRDFEPPEEYRHYLNLINGSGFFWKNYSNQNDIGGGYTQSAITYPYKNYSYFPAGTGNFSQLTNTIMVDDGVAALVGVCDILTINITSNNGVYSFSNTWNIINPSAKNNWNDYPWQGFYFYVKPSWREWDARGFTVFDSYTMSYSGTLEQCLNAVSLIFRNVNLYVDGVQWAFANET